MEVGIYSPIRATGFRGAGGGPCSKKAPLPPDTNTCAKGAVFCEFLKGYKGELFTKSSHCTLAYHMVIIEKLNF
jgi:hypothetical protein